MLLFTIFIISVLFVVSYLIFDKDLLAPPTVVALVFLFACFCCFYNEVNWGLEFSYKSTELIVSGIIATMIGGIIGVCFSNFPKLTSMSFSHEKSEPQEIHVNSIKTVTVIIFQIITLVMLFIHISNLTGYTDWMSAVARYRVLTGRLADVNDLSIRMPRLTRNMVQTSMLIGIIYAYIVGNNLIASRKKLSINWAPIFLCITTTFMQSDRSNVIRLWVVILVTAYTIHMRKIGWRKSRETKKIIKVMVLSIIAVGVVFVGAREIVGRSSDLDPLRYLTFYGGSPIAVLDQYWVNPLPKPDIWGRKTFFYLNESLTALIRWPGNYSFYSPMLKSPTGAHIGNAPTALRDPYVEFGYGGFFFVMMVFGLFYTALYCISRERKGKNPIDFMLFIYAYISYTFFMYFYASFNTYISHVFIKYIVELWLIRWALVGGKFKQRVQVTFDEKDRYQTYFYR